MPAGGIGFSTTFYVLQVIYLLIVIGGLVMAVDTQRATRKRVKAEQDIPSEPLAIYTYTGFGYAVVVLINYLGSFLDFIPGIVPMIAIFCSPIIFFVCMAYLLRVVFAKQAVSSDTARTGQGTRPYKRKTQTKAVGTDAHNRGPTGKPPQQSVGSVPQNAPQTDTDNLFEIDDQEETNT
jgi:hypothetical protein